MSLTTLEVKNSTNATKVSYEDVSKILTVTFKTKSGKTDYEYYDFPKALFEELESRCNIPSFSIGKWIVFNVTKSDFKYKKLDSGLITIQEIVDHPDKYKACVDCKYINLVENIVCHKCGISLFTPNGEITKEINDHLDFLCYGPDGMYPEDALETKMKVK